MGRGTGDGSWALAALYGPGGIASGRARAPRTARRADGPRCSPDASTLYAARGSLQSGFAAPQRISEPEDLVDGASAAVDGHGDALVAWNEDERPHWLPMTQELLDSRRPSRASWRWISLRFRVNRSLGIPMPRGVVVYAAESRDIEVRGARRLLRRFTGRWSRH